MVKTLVTGGALCLAAAVLARSHGAVADWTTPAHTIAADAQRVAVRIGTVDEPGVAPSSNDGNAERQAAAMQVANKPPTVALGVAQSGWSVLFSH
ncbi:hypothetical protein C5O80_02695 [Burkholderia sp. SRS-46]|nr:hypothetical protein C5O80_02695 [Burkholderia sp. SRS-46]